MLRNSIDYILETAFSTKYGARCGAFLMSVRTRRTFNVCIRRVNSADAEYRYAVVAAGPSGPWDTFDGCFDDGNEFTRSLAPIIGQMTVARATVGIDEVNL